MEELLGLLAALFEGLKKRRDGAPAGGAKSSLGRALREAFAQRVPGSASVPGKPPAAPGSMNAVGKSTPGSRVSTPPAAAPGVARDTTTAKSLTTRSGSVGPSGVPPGGTLDAAGPAARAPEAGLVRALFATPQSLVAAFIVAEVLAKPVALREP